MFPNLRAVQHALLLLRRHVVQVRQLVLQALLLLWAQFLERRIALQRFLLFGDGHVAMRAHPVPDVARTICIWRTGNVSRRSHVRLQATSLGRPRHLTPWLRVPRRGCCDSRLRLRGRMRHFSLLCSLVVLLRNRALVLGWRPRNLTLRRWGIPRTLCRRASLCRISRIRWRTCSFAPGHRRIPGCRSLIPGLRIRSRR